METDSKLLAHVRTSTGHELRAYEDCGRIRVPDSWDDADWCEMVAGHERMSIISALKTTAKNRNRGTFKTGEIVFV